jgi:hypothetical protein
MICPRKLETTPVPDLKMKGRRVLTIGEQEQLEVGPALSLDKYEEKDRGWRRHLLRVRPRGRTCPLLDLLSHRRGPWTMFFRESDPVHLTCGLINTLIIILCQV